MRSFSASAVVLATAVLLAACSSDDMSVSPTNAAGSGGSATTPDAGGSAGAGGIVAQAPTATTTFMHARAEAGELLSFSLFAVVADTDGSVILGGEVDNEKDTLPPIHGKPYYNGGSYRAGELTSAEIFFGTSFDTITPSFEIDTPPGTWVEITIAACADGGWSKDFSFGVFAEDNGTITKHTVDGQGDTSGDVHFDALVLPAVADAARITAILFSTVDGVSPRVRGLTMSTSLSTGAYPADQSDHASWGTVLDVPAVSQATEPSGADWSAPAATAMLMQYWGKKGSVDALMAPMTDTANGVFDFVSNATNVRMFNVGYATGAAPGTLHGVVTQLPTIADLETLVKAGIPVAVSLDASHFVVVRGFDANGDVVCNDPEAADGGSTTMARGDFANGWAASQHTAHVLWPTSQNVPILADGSLY